MTMQDEQTTAAPPCTCTWHAGATLCERHHLDNPAPPTPAPPAYLIARPGSLADRSVACGYCGEQVFWGKTINGVPSPFDAKEPRVNHHSTCTGLKEARRGGKIPRKL